VPVFDFAGTPVGAINVSGPVAAFAQQERRTAIGENLRTAGSEISRRLGWIDGDRADLAGKEPLRRVGHLNSGEAMGTPNMHAVAARGLK
jgi:hypothetical protein